MRTTAAVKHAIKRIDRLFGNEKLQNHSWQYYSDMAHWLPRGNTNPTIIVDWSGLTKCGQYHFLCAALPVKGRALPLLKIAYPLSEYTTKTAHRCFMQTLKSLLPTDCCPTIVTDAGFRCPWFKLIKSMGRNFVGRVRHKTQFSTTAGESWHEVKTLYERAKLSAHYLFDGLLAKANPLHCSFYIVKQRKKNRVRKNLAGKKIQCSVSKKHEKSGNEPWLLISSLLSESISAHQIVAIYSKRMQIEEFFRDLKSNRQGCDLRHCRLIRPYLTVRGPVAAVPHFANAK